jgi:hypothetical protein
MTRQQVLERLLAAHTPPNVGAIEAALRAITARIDVVAGTAEYDAVHARLDELLTARDRGREDAARAATAPTALV